MLSNNLATQLNIQIQREATASDTYLAMASWCENNNLGGVADYFYYSAEDERGHMLEIYRYINNYGGFALLKPMSQAKSDFKDLVEVFEIVIALEESVSVAINQLTKLSCDEADYATFQFLQPFVKEQLESVKSVRDLHFMIKSVGIDSRNLYLINKEFKKMMVKKMESK